jgi:CHAT domain-containing protein/tetratricopeptide (TPR) repeat protein
MRTNTPRSLGLSLRVPRPTTGALVLAVGAASVVWMGHTTAFRPNTSGRPACILEQVVEANPRDVLAWTDLAAVRSSLGAQSGDLRMLFKGLAAADHALAIDSTFGEANFQRAVVLERIGLASHAAKAYSAFLKLDPSCVRAAEALRRMREQRQRSKFHRYVLSGPELLALRAAAVKGDRARFDQIAPQLPQHFLRFAAETALASWADAILTHHHHAASMELSLARELGRSIAMTSGDLLVADAVAVIDTASRTSARSRTELLARAHRLYANGPKQPWENPAETLAHFEGTASLFRRAGSPMTWEAEYQRERAQQFWTTLADTTCQTISNLIVDTPRSYPSLRTQMYEIQAECFASIGDYYEAYRTSALALPSVEGLHDPQKIADVRFQTAYYAERWGDRDTAWRLRATIFTVTPPTQFPFVRDMQLTEIARSAISESTWDVAQSIASLIIDSPSLGPNLSRVEARGLRAIAAWNRGDLQSAKHDLVQARIEITMPNDPALHWIEATNLALNYREHPGRSTEYLAKSFATAIVSSTHQEGYNRVLQRSRAFRKRHKRREAAAELSRAKQIRAAPLAATVSDTLSGTDFGVGNDIHNDLVDLLEARGDEVGAFAVSERGRARQLLDRMGYAQDAPIGIQAIRQALPPGTLVVSFVTLRDRLVVFALDRQNFNVIRVHIGREEIGERIDTLTTAIRRGRGWRLPAASIYDLLLGSLPTRLDKYDRVVFIPDALLERVPFVALINPSTRRYLIESSSVVIAPSATVFVKLSAMPEAHRETATVVGDPAFDSATFPGLGRLPAAAAEAKEIATLYRSTALIGDTARREPILERMRQTDIVHIGAHTVTSTTDPLLSGIPMGSGELHLRDVAARRVRRGSIAVLAGCRTAAGSGPPDMNSFALAFLAAGSRSTVGSLWNIDDRATRSFSVQLHRLLRADTPVSDAVRSVQLEMLRSRDPSLRDVRSWAGFQVYGGG